MVGGGFYGGFTTSPISEAWDLFGPANGVTDLDQMRRRVGHYRRQPVKPDDDPPIGCLLLRDVRFFPTGLDAPPPADFALNVVQGKGYDLAADPTVTRYFQDLLDRLLGQHIPIGAAADLLDDDSVWQRRGAAFGDPRLARQRLGQQAFQAVVLDAYQRHCAITGTAIRPVLQAAHVRPLTAGGQHRLDNAGTGASLRLPAVVLAWLSPGVRLAGHRDEEWQPAITRRLRACRCRHGAGSMISSPQF